MIGSTYPCCKKHVFRKSACNSPQRKSPSCVFLLLDYQETWTTTVVQTICKLLFFEKKREIVVSHKCNSDVDGHSLALTVQKKSFYIQNGWYQSEEAWWNIE
jgi:hypothetical protein